MPSNPVSGASTPNPRFTSQSKTAEDLLSTQTVGLVALSDFRKRRAEALEQKERDAQDALLGGSGAGARSASGTATPSGNSDG
jgi:protein FAM50